MNGSAWAARRTARVLVDHVRDRHPDLVRIGGIDLGPALEHGIFIALRDERLLVAASRGGSRARALARIALRSVSGRRRRERDGAEPGPVLLLAASDVHVAIWRPVAAALADRGIATSVGSSARLDPAWMPRLVRHARRVAAARHSLERSWQEVDPRSAVLARLAAASLPRYALAAAQLDSLVHELRPVVLVCYNEVGPLSRLAPAVAHANGLSAVDLPHAEAADPAAIAGIEYDAIGVFGERAVEVMTQAGVPAERLFAIGAPHVEALLSAARDRPPVDERRIIFTSQFIGGSMSRALKERTLRAGLAVAEVAAPSRLVIRPHPLEQDDVAIQVLRDGPIPPGVSVSIEAGRPLVEHLPGAWALVTAWSNTAYEAAALGVPVIAVNASGGPAVLPLAQESIALGAVDAETAAAAAHRLLDDEARRTLIETAAERVTLHLGPLDRRSAQRAADLVLAHVRPLGPT